MGPRLGMPLGIPLHHGLHLHKPLPPDKPAVAAKFPLRKSLVRHFFIDSYPPTHTWAFAGMRYTAVGPTNQDMQLHL